MLPRSLHCAARRASSATLRAGTNRREEKIGPSGGDDGLGKGEEF